MPRAKLTRRKTPSSAAIAAEPSDRLLRYYLRDPEKAYRDFHLWVPAVQGTPAVLCGLTLDTSKGPLVLFRRYGTHLQLPRHYPWQGRVEETPIAYARVRFDDRVTTRPGQADAWAALRMAKCGVLQLICGKGKTVLALKKIAHEGVTTLVVVPAGIIPQWVKAAQQFLGVTPGIVQGSKQEWDRPLVVASSKTIAQSGAKLPLELRTRFGLTIYDECHHMSSEELSKVAPLFSGMSIGLTATVNRADGTEAAYLYQLGPVFFMDTKPDLVPQVHFVQLGTQIDMEDASVFTAVTDCRGDLSVPRLRSYLGAMPERNAIIAEHVRRAHSHMRSVLALTHSKAGAYALRDLLGDIAVAVTGDMRNLNARMAAYTSGKIVVATTDVAAEALDAAHLDTLMLLTPFTTERLIIQAPGRVLRAHPDKGEPIVVVFEDTAVHVLRNMCKKLRKGFVAQGFPVRNATDAV